MTTEKSGHESRPTSWDTLEPGLDFGMGTGYRVIIEVGLTPDTAQNAGISESTELQLVTTIDGARDIARKLLRGRR